jgi:hypothetical protein
MDGGVAPEHIDTAHGDFALDEPAVRPPEDPRRHRAEERIGPARTHSHGHIDLVGRQPAKELDDHVGGLLQVRRHHREVGAASHGHALADRGERAEVAREREQLGAHPGLRETLLQSQVGAVGRPVDHEHGLETAVEFRVHPLQAVDELRDAALVLVHGHHD